MARRPIFTLLVLILMLILAVYLAACTGKPTPEPTPIPSTLTDTRESTDTPQPTETPLPMANSTRTAAPTSSSSSYSDDNFVQPIAITSGGYAFVPYPLYGLELHPGQATMANPEQTILFALISAPIIQDETLTETLQRILASMQNEFEPMVSGELNPTLVAEKVAFEVDFTGFFFDSPVTGRLILVESGYGRRFYSIAIAFDPPLSAGWEEEGENVYSFIFDSVSFFEPWDATCTTSTDASYGYDNTNPIKVGGGMAGAPRERFYLDNLLGPNGESVTYFRLGAVPSANDPLVDEYQITYSGLNEPIHIYISAGLYETLSAPAGLTCAGSFLFAGME